MARFIILSTIYGQPPGNQPRKWPRGTTIADSTGNAQPGDIVWPAIANAPSPINVAPLDAAGQALIPGSVIVTLAQLAANPGFGNPGVNTGYGAGLDAGD
jgi:hypothetical protein